MVISPLLRWYVEHGLKVTQIHKVVEYAPAASRNSEKTSEDRSDPESLRMERTEKDIPLFEDRKPELTIDNV